MLDEEGEGVRILHVSDGWAPRSGVATVARLLADEQRSAGHVVDCRRWVSVSELRAADEVWIHCGWKPCLWWAAWWAKRVLWVPHGCYDPVRLGFRGWKKVLAGPFERCALRRSERILGTCEAETGWVKRYLGARCPEVGVTDLCRFFRLDQSPSAKALSRPVHVLYLGRRHPLKGVERLERAVSEVNRTSERSNARIIDLRIVSDALGEEKEKVWTWCDVLCLPTLSDNFGLVVAEALERGKRVVVTDGAPAWNPDGGAETVGRGYGGRLVYLRGYRAGDEGTRVELLKAGLAACRTA